MTWPCVRLFARAGLPYPGRDKVIQVLDKYRREGGWITVVIPCPSVDFTYFGLGIAQAILTLLILDWVSLKRSTGKAITLKKC